MNNTMTFNEIDKEFEKQFLYTVVLGSTLNDGNALRWNVGDGKMPDIDKIKSFLKQSFIKYLQKQLEVTKRQQADPFTESEDFLDGFALCKSKTIATLEAQIKEIDTN